jgi:hypothetical protein
MGSNQVKAKKYTEVNFYLILRERIYESLPAGIFIFLHLYFGSSALFADSKSFIF